MTAAIRAKVSLNGRPWSLNLPAAGGTVGSTTGLYNVVVNNWSSSPTNVFHQCLVCFAAGAIPNGSSPIVKRGSTVIASQWDDITRYPDGSWKFAVLNMRDDSGTIAGNGSATYTVYQNLGVAPTNVATLSASGIATAHNVNVKLTSLQQSTDGTTFGAVGSGTFVASFATHAAVSTRIERTRTGVVCEEFYCWGMFTDNTGGAADAHLKINWYVRAWKNASGAIVAVQPACVLAQDWWSISGKALRQYTATLYDGTTSIVSYSTVQHPYNSQWLMCLNDGSYNRGKAPWLGATMPTISSPMDQVAWALFMPPYKLTRSRSALSTSGTITYVPCGSADQRADVDGTGGYDGRGTYPNTATIAYCTQTASDLAVARVNALVALHFPGHYRSNRTRIRPGDSASDIANTVIALDMTVTDGSGAPYDFTAVGLPIPVDAYADPRTDPSLQDGYVAPLGGDGVWTLGGDGSHQVNYGGLGYLQEAHRYLIDACFDHAVCQVVSGLGNSFGNVVPLNTISALASPPATTFYALGGFPVGQERCSAWALNIIAFADAFAPDNHVAALHMRRLSDQQAKFYAAVVSYLPAGDVAAGVVPGAYAEQTAICSPWMDNFSGVTGWNAYRLTGRAGYKTWAGLTANLAVGLATQAPFLLTAYRLVFRQLTNYPAGNSALAPAAMRFTMMGLTGPGTTLTVGQPGAPNYTWLLLNGDTVVPVTYDNSSNAVACPAELTQGTAYYVVNLTGAGTNTMTLGLATTPGGTPINFSSSAWFGVSIAPASMTSITVSAYPPYLSNADDYAPIGLAAIVEASKAGYPGATSALVAKMVTFLTNVTGRDVWATWDYDLTP